MIRWASVASLIVFASAAIVQAQVLDNNAGDDRKPGRAPGLNGNAFQPLNQFPFNGEPRTSRLDRLPALRPSAPSPSGPVRKDHFGDAMPPGAVARYGTIRLRHGPEPRSLSFSADGKLVASLSTNEDDGIRLWDVVTGKEVARHEGQITDAALTPDGQVVIVSGEKCLVWSPALNTRRTLPDTTLPEETSTVVVAPDSRTFAVGSSGRITLIDIQTGKTTCVLKLPNDQAPLRFVFSPDHHWLAGCAADRMGLWLWDLKTGKRIRTYLVKQDFVDFAFSADSKRLVIAGDTLRIFSIESEEQVEGFHSPETGPIFQARFASDGKHLFVLQLDGTVLKLDAATGAIQQSWAPPNVNLHNPLAIAPDMNVVAAVDISGSIRIWDPRTGKGTKAVRFGAFSDPSFSADSKHASVLDQQGRIHTFDMTTGRPDSILALPADADSFTPAIYDARTGRAVVLVAGESFEVHVLDIANKKLLAKIHTNSNADPGIAFSPTHQDRLAVFVPGTVTIHSIATGRAIRTLNVGHAEELNPRGAFSPDGRLLAVTSRPFAVWELATGKKRFECDAVPDPHGIAFSSNGRWLAVWGMHGSVAIIDVRTGVAVRRFTLPSADNAVNAAAFTHDGKRLITGSLDGPITVWNTVTGEPVLNLLGHEGVVTGLVISADGRYLLSSALDGTALIWDLTAKADVVTVPTVTRLEDAFELLGSVNAARAHSGQGFLYHQPAAAIALLSAKLPVAKAVPATTIQRLITDLGSEDYQTRRAAMNSLIQLGGEALPALYRVREGSDNPEVCKLTEEALQRLEAILSQPEHLRIIRAVEVLENLAREEGQAKDVREAARNVLKKWASGPHNHWQTLEAEEAMKRLELTKP